MRITFFRISFSFVFLVGSNAVLPDVGSCTFMEYFCSTRKCNGAFYKAFQKDPKADCAAVFSKMKDCVINVMKFCRRDQLTESQIKDIIDAIVKKEEVCDKGRLGLPIMPASINPCSASFKNDVTICVGCLRRTVIKDKSDPALCSEYAETKKCLRDLIDSDCNHPAESKKEFLDLYYSVYNPFCADNRDPGATKNDSCYGVLDVSAAAGTAGTPLALGVYNPLCADNRNPEATKNGQCYGVSAAVGTKLSVFLTLMFAFFSVFVPL